MKKLLLILVVLTITITFNSCKKKEDPDPTTSSSTTGNPPSTAPVLSTPQNGATGLWPPITLGWSDVSDATTYELESWITQNVGSTVFKNEKSISTNSYTIKGNYSNGFKGETVYWKIRGENSNGTGSWSAVWSFVLTN